jgi:hypothetical protein
MWLCGLLGWPAGAWADSACWPEREMLARQADSWLWLQLPADARLPVLDAAGHEQGSVACAALATVKGVCGDEYVALPLKMAGAPAGRAQAALADGGLIWLATAWLGAAPPARAPAVPLGAAQAGALRGFVAAHARRPWPAWQAVLRGVQGEGFTSTDGAQSFTRVAQTLRRVPRTDGVWFLVAERLVFRDLADPMQRQRLGPVLRSGYLLHSDRVGQVQAVVEDSVCD